MKDGISPNVRVLYPVVSVPVVSNVVLGVEVVVVVFVEVVVTDSETEPSFWASM